MIPYFNDLYDYFGSGPPVYFVTKEYNYTHRAEQKAVCGRFTTCDEFSLGNIFVEEAQRQDLCRGSEVYKSERDFDNRGAWQARGSLDAVVRAKWW